MLWIILSSLFMTRLLLEGFDLSSINFLSRASVLVRTWKVLTPLSFTGIIWYLETKFCPILLNNTSILLATIPASSEVPCDKNSYKIKLTNGWRIFCIYITTPSCYLPAWYKFFHFPWHHTWIAKSSILTIIQLQVIYQQFQTLLFDLKFRKMLCKKRILAKI